MDCKNYSITKTDLIKRSPVLENKTNEIQI